MRALPIVLYAVVAVMGCVQAGEPLTAEDRCVLLCEGNGSGHPCAGEEPTDDCVAQCTKHITPLEGDCLTCVLTQSGWIGSACECEDVDAFGNINVTCDLCLYTTHTKKCASNDACERDLATCDGFTLVKPTDSFCSPACGG